MISSMVQSIPQGYVSQKSGTINAVNTDKHSSMPKLNSSNEQSMAITYDISAEYSAINKMNSILTNLTQEIKQEKNPDRIKLLEARISTINTMILQREARINQMEQIRAQIDNQFFVKN